MSKKPKKPTKRIPPPPRPLLTAPIGESRGGEAATVAWMLTALATSAADLGALALWLLGVLWPGGRPDAQGAMFLPALVLFIAAVTGLVCLLLTPVVYRVRREPPPRAITVFAVIASAIPLGVFVALLFK